MAPGRRAPASADVHLCFLLPPFYVFGYVPLQSLLHSLLFAGLGATGMASLTACGVGGFFLRVEGLGSQTLHS